MAADREGLGVQAAYSVTKLANWKRRAKRTVDKCRGVVGLKRKVSKPAWYTLWSRNGSDSA